MSVRSGPPGGAERRVFSGKVEFRAATDGKSLGTLFGYAAVFNQMSLDLGGFREQITPGAFRGCLGDDVRCLRNHDDDLILGRSAAGTLRFEEDALGLRFECDVADTTTGRDTVVSINRGDITGCSFQFRVADGGDVWDWNGAIPIRTVTKYSRLYDVGPVTFPAYEQTSVECRSFADAKARHDDERRAAVARDLEHAKARQRYAEAVLLPPID